MLYYLYNNNIYHCFFLASLGAFTVGVLFTWTSPSIPILISNSSHIKIITLEEASYFTVIPSIAAVIVVPFLSMLLDIIGRKKMLIFISIPQVVAYVLIIVAEDYLTFYISRIASGIADAVLFCAVPMYMGEVAVPSVRGSWGNLFAVSINLGQFFVNVVGAYCDIRTTAGICCCVPIICFLLSLIIPESPYYLIMKGREEEARDSLRILRWSDNIDEEFETLTNDVHRQISESGTYKDLFMIPTNRKALIISIFLRGSQQLSGLTAFAVYTQYMFNQAGGNISGSVSSIIYTAVLLVTIVVVSFFVDKFGRKTLMIFSSITCGIVLLIEATYFYIDTETTINVSNFTWLPVTGMIMYIVLCSIGLGIIPTLMLGELFSASVKSKALSILLIAFAIYVIAVSKLFQVLTVNFGMYVSFYLFSACCFASTIISYYWVPETKGKTLEEIQQDLKRM